MVSEIRTSIDRRSAVSGEAIRARIGPVGASVRPLWSVMIPTHDCAAYLRHTLASVLAQDPGPELMQIEVVDDASSDAPEAVVEELGRGRVGFFRQPRNVGHVANFNTCLERSRGRLVHLLHGDDCVRDGFYAAMGRLLEAEHHGRRGVLPLHRDRRAGRLEQHRRARAALRRADRRLAREDRRRPAPADAVHGGAPRRSYERLGGFDGRAGLRARTGRCGSGSPRTIRSPTSRQPLALYRVHHASPDGPHGAYGRERPGPAPGDRDQPRALPAGPGRRDRSQGAARDGHHLPAPRPQAARRRRHRRDVGAGARGGSLGCVAAGARRGGRGGRGALRPRACAADARRDQTGADQRRDRHARPGAGAGALPGVAARQPACSRRRWWSRIRAPAPSHVRAGGRGG